MIEGRRSFTQLPETKKKDKDKKSKRKLDSGQIVKSKNNAWTVTEILGSGGFGYVYKVSNEQNEVNAMKTEYNDPKGRKSNDRLKIEMALFTEFNAQTESEKTRHFLKMIDKGQTEQFKYIVMTLVSHSLDILRRDYLDSMTWTSIFNISLQTLRAIEDLHAVGYLHRDIKPHNFAIGLPPKDTTIYMIDFGISRRYVERDGKLRVPRQSVRFLGTVRFASRNCHNEREQCRRDDLESWCYMVLDLFNPDNITWRRVGDRVKVAVMKHQLFTRQDGKEIDAPKEFSKILSYVNSLGYADVPDYGKIREHLETAAKEEKLDLTRKFDWVGVELKKKLNSKKKGANAANRITDDEEETEPSKKKKKEERRKRFSMEQDESTTDDEPVVLPKPPTRRAVHSKPAHLSPIAMPPSSKARLRKSGFAGGNGSLYNTSMSKHQTGTSSKNSTNSHLQTAVQRDQNSIVSHAQTISGVAPNYPKSNYNTAIPRVPSQPAPALVPISSIPAPSRRKKGG